MSDSQQEITVEVTIPETPTVPETPIVIEENSPVFSQADADELAQLRADKEERDRAEAEETRLIAEEAARTAQLALDLAISEPEPVEEPEPVVVVEDTPPQVEAEPDEQPNRDHWWFR